MSTRPLIAVLSVGRRPRGEPLRETRRPERSLVCLPAVSALNIRSYRKRTRGWPVSQEQRENQITSLNCLLRLVRMFNKGGIRIPRSKPRWHRGRSISFQRGFEMKVRQVIVYGILLLALSPGLLSVRRFFQPAPPGRARPNLSSSRSSPNQRRPGQAFPGG